MLIPKETASAQIVAKGSRFLAESFLVDEQSKARDLVKAQKQKYADATHVCHAFIIGKKAEILGMSDDGEPGGTAGRPMLDVLKGKGCTDILVTVARWFGGTLLGTGGLVRAYGDAVKAVVGATSFEELVDRSSFSLSCGYDSYQGVRRLLEQCHASNIEENFAEGIRISGNIASADSAAFAKSVTELTNGKVLPVII